jgi:hypothetical protein
MTRSLAVASLQALISIMSDKGVNRLYLKRLQPNDNSKNQPYLGSDISSVGFLPMSDWAPSRSVSKKKSKKKVKFSALLPMSWVDGQGRQYMAPNTKIIFYPQYPEVRFSGFLQGSRWESNGLFDPAKGGREPGRVLFFGVKPDNHVICYACDSESSLGKEINAGAPFAKVGIFEEVPLSGTAVPLDTRLQLLDHLRRIHREGWIDSKRFNRDGNIVPCPNRNCGGYTLEAEFGIIPNGHSEPDYLGWELKQYGVGDLNRPQQTAITLMTPEPTGGFYGDNNVLAFVRKYGRPSTRHTDRLDFTGVHKIGVSNPRTGMTLTLLGYDATANGGAGEITDVENGAVALLDRTGGPSALWHFSGLMSHWNRKHQQCAYVQSQTQQVPTKQYMYGSRVELGIDTRFGLFLRAMNDGLIKLDPASKVEGNSTPRPKTKARNQFRIRSGAISRLYTSIETEDVS